jgi:membrane-bound metal-dependent hydrolase YbcI (DUF457 family)
MPSILGHSAIGATAAYVCKTRFPEIKFGKFFALTLLATNLPDIDIVLHRSVLSQFEALAHRNFCHSLLFAAIASTLLGFVCYYKLSQHRGLTLSFYFFLVMTSHDVIDALTKGYGVAFLYPFDKTQYNFPLTPLNPAGWTFTEFSANNAFGREGLFVWLPMLFISAAVYCWRRYRQFDSNGRLD